MTPPSRMTGNADAELSAQKGWEAAAIECSTAVAYVLRRKVAVSNKVGNREDPIPKQCAGKKVMGGIRALLSASKTRSNYRFSDPYR